MNIIIKIISLVILSLFFAILYHFFDSINLTLGYMTAVILITMFELKYNK